jgi:hypothetical protein
MMPITNFLSCTEVLDGFESLSPAQRYHAKIPVTGLVAGRNKTGDGHRTRGSSDKERPGAQ